MEPENDIGCFDSVFESFRIPFDPSLGLYQSSLLAFLLARCTDRPGHMTLGFRRMYTP
jgi:hypothetical protein